MKLPIKDAIKLGNYLLSEKRKKRFEAISKDRLEERLSEVTDADIRNCLGDSIQ